MSVSVTTISKRRLHSIARHTGAGTGDQAAADDQLADRQALRQRGARVAAADAHQQAIGQQVYLGPIGGEGDGWGVLIGLNFNAIQPFMGENMNRLRAGSDLSVPSADKAKETLEAAGASVSLK